MNNTWFGLRWLLRLAWRLDRRRFVIGMGLLLPGALATPAVALALKKLVDAVVVDAPGAAAAWGAVAAVVLLCELMLGHFAHLYYFELAEITDQRLHRELLRAANGSDWLELGDDPSFGDRVDLVRQDVQRMRAGIIGGLPMAALAAQLAVTAVVLGVLSPLLLLLPVVAVLPVVFGRRAEHLLESARERTAPVTRTIRHYRRLMVDPRSQQEIRLMGNARYLLGKQAELLATYQRTMNAAQWRSAALRLAGQLAFALGYVGSVLYVYQLARRGEATVGDVILVVTLATQIATQMAAGLDLFGDVYASASGVRRLLQLRDESRRRSGGSGTTPLAVERMTDGIRFDNVSFTYAGSDRTALRDVDLHLPAGTCVALVGENGAGKSTLIKVLTGLYPPTAGRVLVDGVDLAATEVTSWRRRTATLFQDFARIDLTLQHSVGVGHLPDVDSREAVTAAMHRARATALLERIGDTGALIGSGYGDGTELSGGQWQRVGFARAVMRTEPMLLSLDEPGHSLDALAEQQVCDAYQATAREVAARVGGVTLFVTHRMSTVRLADLIVVLDGGRVVERGTHDELVAAGGRYAELFHLQSRAYTE
ncbi:ABC transporter ATP-binding protein/permease [Micromonospora rifamycinica]|nr:ABC transporter ATP-binding protein [Micromonospora rifamycinica]